jgi:hypothetical protein
MARVLHVIAVDATQTPDEAWEELRVFGERVTDSGLGEYWAVIDAVEDGDD